MTREEFQKLLPGLVKGYKPAPDVIDHVDRLNVLMLVGPSGVGKSTLINALPYRYVPVDNTRPPRPGEVEGVDFFFRTDFEQIIREINAGRFVQLAVDSGGDFKATRASSYPESGTVTMAIMADVVPIIRNLGFAKTTTAFITPPDYDEWMRRLNQHKLEDEALARRLAEAKRSFDFALNDQSTHFILSDNVTAATEQLKNLIDGQVDEARELSAQIIAEQIAHKLNKES